ncbi:hypothetical protein H6F67_19505 [Microcoleus sp. FACHB-1515]|uniref:hypothetical protein n=1 Tax=Cyanophyceae TaxID=3028117 RepID=UPI0016832C79|nr:hypothetical protein [Microcoleus sp. FACHB-1515]MBD2092038.1 hypothetical protein [Microcoleus sp. FACHB-1515]
MKLKSAFAAIAATTALTGAVLITTTAQAQPCIYGEQGGITNTTPSDAPSIDPITTQADVGNLNKLGIVGASFAILGSLFAGGMLLKQRFDRKSEPLIEESQTEVLPSQLPEPLFEPSEFVIVIPPEVLQSIQASEVSDELTSAR